ncbi:hypothetical protein V2A60_010119 [Cordyceps javanica]|uniref:protein-tyrosine-phosphatase n=1 Tax=Cordyceps javanica TaxID=43265 RepID=A0A545UVH8_9HYPO|nr:Dual specificity phosphatase [Cordyceps javanica]TQW05183.1 Dual specificity phosphatase [Cordyceps javanica]
MACLDRSTTPYIPPKPSISEIRPHLFLGNLYSTLNLETLRSNNITALMSLMDAHHGQWGAPHIRNIIPQASHLYIQCLDSSTTDLLQFMSKVCDFIDEHVCAPAAGGGDANVLVHCREGVSRSATMVIAYLMRKDSMSLDDALAEVKEKRKVRPNPNFLDQLRVWEAVGYQVWQDDDMTIPKEAYQAFLDKRAVLLKSKGLTGNEPIGIQSL